MRVEFDAMQHALPVAPRGHRLDAVTFKSCPGSDLKICLAETVSGDTDEFGISRDSWWVIRCRKLPDRTFRITRGSHSMRHLLRRYGFLDPSGCVNHRNAVAEYVPLSTSFNGCRVDVPAELRDATGVPQFYPTSGVCWLTATFWNAFANPALRRVIVSRVPAEWRPLCDRCLFDKDTAEALRKRLWYEFSIGDNVEDNPLNDGRNGFSEFTTLCAKLHIPLMRYKEENSVFLPLGPSVKDRKGQSFHVPIPRQGEHHLLAIRYIDGDHSKFPIKRRINIKGNTYNLLCMWMGHKKCGHQIGLACTGSNWTRNAISDADMHKDGIGPVHINFEGYDGDWWSAYKQLVFITKFGAGGREFCNLSPHNDPDNDLDRFRGSQRGSNSVDLLYEFSNAIRR